MSRKVKTLIRNMFNIFGIHVYRDRTHHLIIELRDITEDNILMLRLMRYKLRKVLE